MRIANGQLAIVLADGSEISSRAIIVAAGARYRTLPLDRWSQYEGAGIYYAATELESRDCVDSEVAVLGGANSAGQAALFLAGKSKRVRLVVRASSLEAGMSRYLAERIEADEAITVHLSTEVSSVEGDGRLETITLTNRLTGERTEVACKGLFCFIGAVPATDWVQGVMLDDHGFVLTDSDLAEHDAAQSYALMNRQPLPFETSVPGIFAVGDVRHGSTKRVAAAAGEGASAVHSVHRAIGS